MAKFSSNAILMFTETIFLGKTKTFHGRLFVVYYPYYMNYIQKRKYCVNLCVQSLRPLPGHIGKTQERAWVHSFARWRLYHRYVSEFRYLALSTCFFTLSPIRTLKAIKSSDKRAYSANNHQLTRYNHRLTSFAVEAFLN